MKVLMMILNLLCMYLIVGYEKNSWINLVWECSFGSVSLHRLLYHNLTVFFSSERTIIWQLNWLIYIQQNIFYEYKYVKFVGNWGKQYYCEFSYKWWHDENSFSFWWTVYVNISDSNRLKKFIYCVYWLLTLYCEL